jgi:hypothetical protein
MSQAEPGSQRYRQQDCPPCGCAGNLLENVQIGTQEECGYS